MSFDNAPDKSNCKVLFCIITAISAIIKITVLLSSMISDAIRTYIYIFAIICILLQSQRCKRLRIPSGPDSHSLKDHPASGCPDSVQIW